MTRTDVPRGTSRSGALVIRGDARRLAVRPGSVNLALISPPYFGLRVYLDDGEPLDGQLGNELTPKDFIGQLWQVMAELWDALDDEGSVIVNLGDKFCGYSGDKWGHGRSLGSSRGDTRVPATGPKSAPILYGVPNKSLMGIPARFVVGILDGEGIPASAPEGSQWVWRQELVWSKANGMPESVTDRCRRSHEVIFHFTKQDRYYANMDEIREPYSPTTKGRYKQGFNKRDYAEQRPTVRCVPEGVYDENPLGKLPGSVWEINTEPLVCPDYMVEDERGFRLMAAKDVFRYVHDRVLRDGNDLPVRIHPIDHYAAFPSELPRRMILAFSAPGICTVCGKGRRTVVAKSASGRPRRDGSRRGDVGLPGYDNVSRSSWATDVSYEPVGSRCDCPDDSAPTRPAVVLDCFGGAGTTAMVARALGRVGVNADLSMDYCRLASWRIWESGHGAKVLSRTDGKRQLSLMDAAVEDVAVVDVELAVVEAL